MEAFNGRGSQGKEAMASKMGETNTIVFVLNTIAMHLAVTISSMFFGKIAH